MFEEVLSLMNSIQDDEELVIIATKINQDGQQQILHQSELMTQQERERIFQLLDTTLFEPPNSIFDVRSKINERLIIWGLEVQANRGEVWTYSKKKIDIQLEDQY